MRLYVKLKLLPAFSRTRAHTMEWNCHDLPRSFSFYIARSSPCRNLCIFYFKSEHSFQPAGTALHTGISKRIGDFSTIVGVGHAGAVYIIAERTHAVAKTYIQIAREMCLFVKYIIVHSDTEIRSGSLVVQVVSVIYGICLSVSHFNDGKKAIFKLACTAISLFRMSLPNR